MPNLYSARSWTLDEPGARRNYVIHSDDVVLANVTRISAPREGEASMPYADPHAQFDERRVIVRAADPDGNPLFHLDRTHESTYPKPAFVTGPDGAPIGSITWYIGGLKQLRTMFSRGGTHFALRDAQKRKLGMLVGPSLRNLAEEGTVKDGSGTEIGRFLIDTSPHNEGRRRSSMRLHGPLTEPLQTLVLASLVGMEILSPAPSP